MEGIKLITKLFVDWAKLKIRIHFSEKELYFREGEMWWLNLGFNIGHEQAGKNDSFERPVLILKKFNQHLLWAVPLTSKIKKDNPYYYKYKVDEDCFAVIVSQLRLVSSKRLCRKIGMFPAQDYFTVKQYIKNLL